MILFHSKLYIPIIIDIPIDIKLGETQQIIYLVVQCRFFLFLVYHSWNGDTSVTWPGVCLIFWQQSIEYMQGPDFYVAGLWVWAGLKSMHLCPLRGHGKNKLGCMSWSLRQGTCRITPSSIWSINVSGERNFWGDVSHLHMPPC